jgi:hypothetical protein
MKFVRLQARYPRGEGRGHDKDNDWRINPRFYRKE